MSTTYRIWHTACRIPFTSSGGASSRSSSSSSSSSNSSSSSCCCCCCCRHTSCHKLMLHIRSRTPHMKGDNRRQRETRPLQSPRSRPHQPTPAPYTKGDTRRQWETTGDKTTSEPKKPTTPTNTQPPHEGRKAETTGDNGRQDHFRASHQPPPTHMKGDNRRQWETTGDKTTSEPKKPTTPTNTHPTQPETTGDNGRQDHFRA